jgi:hypothetical protein
MRTYEKAAPLQIINHLQQRRPIKSKTPELVPILTLDSAQYKDVSSNNQQKAKRQMKKQTIKTTEKSLRDEKK